MKPELKKAIMRTLQVQIDRNNYGMMSSSRPDWSDAATLNRAGIVIDSRANEIRQNGQPVAKIRRNYASRRVNLMYKELKPTLITL